jgi:recombination protein RecT
MVITTNTGQIQTREQKTETIANVLQNKAVKNALAETLPKHMDAERFTRIAMGSLRKNPKLLQCEPASFLSACLQVASLGLEPDTPLGHAYLIPYGKEVTLVVGYEGYIDLAYRSGVVVAIHANVVRDGEEFEWREGSDPFINHKPSATPQTYTSGKQTYLSGRDVTHAYAVAQLLAGGKVQVVMMKSELDAIRTRSRASHDGPWVTDICAMYKKTAIRQLRKYLPMSAQGRAFHMGAALDEAQDMGLKQDFEVSEGLVDSAVKALNEELVWTTTPEHDEDSLQAEMDQPSEHGRCPIHTQAWAENKFGFSHRIGTATPAVWCSPDKIVKNLIQENSIGEAQLNDWLKGKFNYTRSKVELEHLPEIIQWIAAAALTDEEAEPIETPLQATEESGSEPWPS